MKERDYFKEISDIKNLMNRSSRFISLSGTAGIMAGVYAIIGSAIAYFLWIPRDGRYLYEGHMHLDYIFIDLAFIALFSFLTALIITVRKAKQNNEKIWDATTKRLLIHFFIPMVTGGIYICIQWGNQHYEYSSSLMLIFYGLSLVNASKYTLGTIKYLGYLEIVLGLFATLLPGYGFWVWVLGFGVLHILYGGIMYFQEKKL